MVPGKMARGVVTGVVRDCIHPLIYLREEKFEKPFLKDNAPKMKGSEVQILNDEHQSCYLESQF